MKQHVSPTLSTVKKGVLAIGAALAVAAWPAAIAGADPICERGAPSVSYLSAASQSGEPSQTLSYQVRVTNTDTASCSASTQHIDTNVVPTGWSLDFPDTYTQTLPGESIDYTISLTSAANAQNGDVVWPFNAYQYAGTQTYETDFNLTYSVVNAPADTTAPTVTVVSPASGSTVQKNRDTLIQVSYYDFVGVTNVNFYVNGQLLCTGSTASVCLWHPVKKGTYTIEVRAYDAANNVGVATSVVTVH